MEIKVLDIDVNNLEGKLLALGANKVFDAIRVIQYFKNDKDMRDPFLKLTEEGDKLKLTSLDTNNTETKLFVSRREECITLLSTLGYNLISEVEAHRTSYELGTIDFDIDEFPGIPAFLEIDAGEKATMSIEALITKLQLDLNKSGQMSTPEILNLYEKDYFEVYRKV